MRIARQNQQHSQTRCGLKIKPTGFAHLDVLIVVVIVAVGLAFTFALLTANKTKISSKVKHSSSTRGIHQSMVIFAQNNNTHLPGLDGYGNPLPATDPLFGSVPQNTLTGASMSGRYYILLNNSFIAADLMINPQDQLTKWNSPTAMPGTDQFSYSLLRIGTGSTTTNTDNQSNRILEWRDNANSQAILISDRNTGSRADSSSVRSVWSTIASPQADWKGTILWGDNHAEFLPSRHARLGVMGLNTKYGATINTDDFLFSEIDMPGKVGSASAMFGYTYDNY